MYDFTKPWSNDFPARSRSEWRAAVERGRPGLVDALTSEIDPGLVGEPLASTGLVDAVSRPLRATSGWVTAQQYDLRDPAEVARCVRTDAALDLRSAWVRLDPALRAGAKPRGVIRPGVRIATQDDAATLLEATEREGVALWVEAGAAGHVVAELFDRAAKRLGFDRHALRGGVLCDPLATLAETGCLRPDLATALGDLVRVTQWAGREASGLATVEVSAVPYHDAGASAAQELAFAVTTGLVYLRALDGAGVEPAEALPRFVLRFAVGSDLFLEIAKLRAARWLWGRIASKCGVEAAPVRIATRTAWRNRTRLDPWVNLLRGTVESFASIVGGADEIATQPLTEVIGAGDDAARRWALDTQHLLRDESHLGGVLDPAGGSGYVEDLTRKLVDQAWELVRRIEASGGMAEALLLGEIDAWVAEAAESRRQALATGTAALVGTTLHPDLDEARVEATRVEGFETVPAEARLEAPPLPLDRLAEPFEMLRAASRAHRARTGIDPAAVLVVLSGTPKSSAGKEATQRAKAVLAVGGFAAHEVSSDAAEELVGRLGARVVVLCGADEALVREGPSRMQALRGAGASHVLATATDKQVVDALRDAGISGFIRPELDVVELLAELQRAVGVGS